MELEAFIIVAIATLAGGGAALAMRQMIQAKRAELNRNAPEQADPIPMATRAPTLSPEAQKLANLLSSDGQ